MKRFAKKYLTGGGGKNLKNHYKSYSYPSKTFKNLKYFANKFLNKTKNLYQILTFGASDRIGGAEPRAQDDLRAGILCNISAFIKKIITVSKRKPLDRCTEKIQPTAARCLRAANCGSILIEFAVCMPILMYFAVLHS